MSSNISLKDLLTGDESDIGIDEELLANIMGSDTDDASSVSAFSPTPTAPTPTQNNLSVVSEDTYHSVENSLTLSTLQTALAKDPSEQYVTNCEKGGVDPIYEFLLVLTQSEAKECILSHRKQKLTDADLICIAQSMPSVSVETFDIESNEFSEAGAIEFGQRLPECSIKRLIVANNRIGDRGVKAIMEGVAKNGNIRYLDLSNVGFGDEGAAAIAQTLTNAVSLQLLNLQKNGLTDEQIKIICTGLRENNSLTSLILKHNDFGDEGAKELGTALTGNTCLEDIDVSANHIADDGAVSLAKGMSSSIVKKLNIRSNSLRDIGGAALAQCLLNSPVEEFYIGFNLVTTKTAAAVAQALSKAESLQQLDIQGTVLDVETTKQLAEAVKSHKSLVKLAVDFHDQSSEGVKIFAAAISENQTLQDLVIGGEAKVDEQSQQSIQNALNMNKHFAESHDQEAVNIRTKIKQDQERISQLQRALEEMNARIEDEKERARFLETALRSSEQTLNEKNMLLAEEHKRVDDLIKEKGNDVAFQEEIATAKKKIEQDEKEISSLKQHIDALNSSIDSECKKVTSLENSVKEKESRLAAVEKEILLEKQKMIQFKEKIETYEQFVQEKIAETTAKDKIIEESQATIKDLQNKLERVMDEMKKVRQSPHNKPSTVTTPLVAVQTVSAGENYSTKTGVRKLFPADQIVSTSTSAEHSPLARSEQKEQEHQHTLIGRSTPVVHKHEEASPEVKRMVEVPQTTRKHVATPTRSDTNIRHEHLSVDSVPERRPLREQNNTTSIMMTPQKPAKPLPPSVQSTPSKTPVLSTLSSSSRTPKRENPDSLIVQKPISHEQIVASVRVDEQMRQLESNLRVVLADMTNSFKHEIEQVREYATRIVEHSLHAVYSPKTSPSKINESAYASIRHFPVMEQVNAEMDLRITSAVRELEERIMMRLTSVEDASAASVSALQKLIEEKLEKQYSVMRKIVEETRWVEEESVKLRVEHEKRTEDTLKSIKFDVENVIRENLSRTQHQLDMLSNQVQNQSSIISQSRVDTLGISKLARLEQELGRISERIKTIEVGSTLPTHLDGSFLKSSGRLNTSQVSEAASTVSLTSADIKKSAKRVLKLSNDYETLESFLPVQGRSQSDRSYLAADRDVSTDIPRRDKPEKSVEERVKELTHRVHNIENYFKKDQATSMLAVESLVHGKPTSSAMSSPASSFFSPQRGFGVASFSKSDNNNRFGDTRVDRKQGLLSKDLQ